MLKVFHERNLLYSLFYFSLIQKLVYFSEKNYVNMWELLILECFMHFQYQIPFNWRLLWPFCVVIYLFLKFLY